MNKDQIQQLNIKTISYLILLYIVNQNNYPQYSIPYDE